MNPRSPLHALEPGGLGTTSVESLLSYFCRLAVSHAVSTTDLAHWVRNAVAHDIRADFEWQQRNLSGMGEASRNWAAWLSALTGVAGLDALTLTRGSEVLSPRGLAPKRAHWCPLCLAEDREAGRSPYFRLSWEVGAVEACHRHKVCLVDVCPHCGQQKVRHQAGIVVPGWCVRCGGFLGEAMTTAASPHALWVARQVEEWLGSGVQPAAHSVLDTLNALILGLDGGQPARFAKRIGLAKSSVHGWLKQGGLPSLEAWLAMAAHSGLSLWQVMSGALSGWTPRTEGQVAMPFELAPKRPQPSRQHDWPAIQAELEAMLRLPVAISVAEAGRRLGIDDRLLYLRANPQARALGDRWRQQNARNRLMREAQLRELIQVAAPGLLSQGLPVNLTTLRQVLPHSVLDAVEGVFAIIHDERDKLPQTVGLA